MHIDNLEISHSRPSLGKAHPVRDSTTMTTCCYITR